MLSTRTLKKFPDLTVEDLIKANRAFLNKFDGYRSVLKCSPEAYIAIKDLFLDEEQEKEIHKYIKAENMKRRGQTYEEPKNYWGSLFGIEIKLDPDLLPGQWRFE